MKKTRQTFLLFTIVLFCGGFSPLHALPPATTYYTITGGSLDAMIWSSTSHTGANCSCSPCLCSPCNIPSNAVIRIAHPVTINCNIVIGSNTTLIVESGGSLNVTGNSSISGTGNLQVDAGGTMSVSGNMNLSGTGSVMVNGGLHVGGNLTMSGSSTLCGSGVVSVDGTLTGVPCQTVVLPVELLSFDVVVSGNRVNLYWSTASETNNHYFSVERSKDGESWTEIARVHGAGTTPTRTDYTETDFNPLKGVSYYRIRQVDTDGKTTISKTVVARNTSTTGTPGVRAFPNPFTGSSFHLEFTGFGDEEVLVVLRDIQGKEFYSKVYLIDGSAQIVAVDLGQQLAPGLYLVVASSNEGVVSRKILLE